MQTNKDTLSQMCKTVKFNLTKGDWMSLYLLTKNRIMLPFLISCRFSDLLINFPPPLFCEKNINLMKRKQMRPDLLKRLVGFVENY